MSFFMHVPLPMDVFMELSDYMESNYIKDEFGDVLGQFIREWIRSDRSAKAGLEPGAPPTMLEGYQWKELFLPPGTRLRTTYKGQRHHAEVVGDRIVFGEREVSPSSFVNVMSTAPRSAWRTIWLLFPDERTWCPAARCLAEATKPRPADRERLGVTG